MFIHCYYYYSNNTSLQTCRPRRWHKDKRFMRILLKYPPLVLFTRQLLFACLPVHQNQHSNMDTSSYLYIFLLAWAKFSICPNNFAKTNEINPLEYADHASAIQWQNNSPLTIITELMWQLVPINQPQYSIMGLQIRPPRNLLIVSL